VLELHLDQGEVMIKPYDLVRHRNWVTLWIDDGGNEKTVATVDKVIGHEVKLVESEAWFDIDLLRRLVDDFPQGWLYSDFAAAFLLSKIK